MEEKIKGGTIVGVWNEPKKAEPKEEKAKQPKETKKKTK